MAKTYKIIGLMSGTSCDGIDAAYIETDGINQVTLGPGISLPYTDGFSTSLVGLTQGNKEKLPDVEKELTTLHADAVNMLLNDMNLSPEDIDLIGFHGHTIEHDISKKSTIQIGDLELLTKLTDTTVIGDFRSNDVSNGGQGAPLVPIFLKALSNTLDKPLLFLNIGGVANLTYISEEELIGFDTGPGNALINDAMMHFYNLRFDDLGQTSRSGIVDYTRIEDWLGHPYFAKPYPKSLDRNDFAQFFQDAIKNLGANDAIATLTFFTCAAIKRAIEQLPNNCSTCYVSGGGRHNQAILDIITKICKIDVKAVESLDLNGDYLEAHAFGYLAARSYDNLPITFPSTTNVETPLPGGRVAKVI